MTKYVRPYLSHLGIFVRDLELLERFYTSVFGLMVTDRGVGKTFNNSLVFLSGNPEQHHQLVLSTGRGPDTPSTVMQISFMVNSLDELRALRTAALAHGATEMFGLNHGNAWSIYFNDPEGNKVEVYVDTPFHTPQPCGALLDLEKSDEEVLADTATLVSALPGSMPRADYVAEMARHLAPGLRR
ncbi:MAG: VOC family protein [Rhodospirillaceae bacterium]|nr:MAG: VOC family protein [Rhodospirillaceae bacterium]